ncbi:MAG: hypothetical protein JJT75_01085 [Opitutales bacterium]|nr:hypothetical protein [Opitutales bacterium]MCH8541226.1 hypothetical protein [Opitutales bacterium]
MTLSIPSLPEFVLFIALFFAPAETTEIHIAFEDETFILQAEESHWRLQPGEERISREGHQLIRDGEDHDLREFKNLLQDHDWEEEPVFSPEEGKLRIEAQPSQPVKVTLTLNVKGVENRDPFVYTISFDPAEASPDNLLIHLTQERLTLNGETLSSDSLRSLLENETEPLLLKVVIEPNVPFGQAQELLQIAQENNHRIVFQAPETAP